jgi:hypothetical protein
MADNKQPLSVPGDLVVTLELPVSDIKFLIDGRRELLASQQERLEGISAVLLAEIQATMGDIGKKEPVVEKEPATMASAANSAGK